ncbi:MAG TPA: DUF5682 family protein [Anaerolineae bacterium]|nr:DUF5682 family protein [Anaerolineae bacterium]
MADLHLPDSLQPLRQQILAAAKTFTTDAQHLSQLLTTIINDVDRAAQEPLPYFPVAHHAPSAAIQLTRRLHQHPPRAIYIEMPADFRPLIDNLYDCTLPIAFQAFAAENPDIPPHQLPLSIVAPLTEASAEYQAIAFALQNPATHLLFVDRPADLIVQWAELTNPPNPADEEEPDENAQLHGHAHALATGDLTPTFDQFVTHLLRNSKTQHFTEWWTQYVEQAIITADFDTYRHIMFLMGSLIRHLGRHHRDLAIDQKRESYMWTQIKQHLNQHQIDPQDALFICGAAHTASQVPEVGVASPALAPPPTLTPTKWHYGLIPSSFAAIEYQFNQPPGSSTMTHRHWQKTRQALKLKPFTLTKKSRRQPTTPKPTNKTDTTPPPTTTDSLTPFLQRPPQLLAQDEEQLLTWSARIVKLARDHGYLASTADAIAIHHTANLLANLRGRPHPTPYDFQDAAITCLEKERTPKQKNIRQLCRLLLGGDRVGRVGYASLPPLAQDVYDRLKPLANQIKIDAKTNQRALIDLQQNPDLIPCSDLLWRLHYLLGPPILIPIMGQRALGHTPTQESWDIRLGKYQRQFIELGYQAVTVEQCLAQQLRRHAHDPQISTADLLALAEDSLLYLPHNPTLTTELGQQATRHLTQETGAGDAPSIFDRIRRLIHHFRAQPDGLPSWLEQFVTTGYTHYTSLLPQAFADQGTSPAQIAAMLAFILTLESLALSLGCQRDQLLIALDQIPTANTHPAKIGLLWSADWLLNRRTIEAMRAELNQISHNPLRLSTLPDYLNGFILALNFAPGITPFIVERLSHLFATLPDHLLLPWLPNFLLQLRPHQHLLTTLIAEANQLFPATLTDLDSWLPPFTPAPTPLTNAQPSNPPTHQPTRTLLLTHPHTAQALLNQANLPHQPWPAPTETAPIETINQPIINLLTTHPHTLNALLNIITTNP